MDIKVIQTLEDNLLKQITHHQELIDFLEVEKKHLLNLNLDGLLGVSKSKEKIAQSIIKGAITLKESLTSASLMLGLSIDPLPTLAEVASLIPSPMGNNIADEVSQLARLKNLIVRENGMAKQFVEKSLELVTESLNILSGADQIKGESYQSDGKKEKGVKKALPSKISREV